MRRADIKVGGVYAGANGILREVLSIEGDTITCAVALGDGERGAIETKPLKTFASWSKRPANDWEAEFVAAKNKHEGE